LNGIKIGQNTDAPHGGICNIKGCSLPIGRHWDAPRILFTGSIDDVRIYSRALPEAETLCNLEKSKESNHPHQNSASSALEGTASGYMSDLEVY
jgi:hypothetical protein